MTDEIRQLQITLASRNVYMLDSGIAILIFSLFILNIWSFLTFIVYNSFNLHIEKKITKNLYIIATFSQSSSFATTKSSIFKTNVIYVFQIVLIKRTLHRNIITPVLQYTFYSILTQNKNYNPDIMARIFLALI